MDKYARDEQEMFDELVNSTLALIDRLCPHTPGCLSRASFVDLILQAVMCNWRPLKKSSFTDEIKIRAIMSELVQLAPRSIREAKLAIQMLAVHDAAMDCQSRTFCEGQTVFHRDYNLKYAQKLMGLYLNQTAVLEGLISRRSPVAPKTARKPLTGEGTLEGDTHLQLASDIAGSGHLAFHHNKGGQSISPHASKNDDPKNVKK